MNVNDEYIVMFKHPYTNRNEARIETFKGICENFISGSNGLCAFVDAENRMLLVNYHDIVQMKPVKKNKSMINLPLSNKEWYFLHIQLESIIKEKRSALSEYAMAVHARQMLCIHERNKLERYISSIQDRYIQRIFRFRFIDCLTWNEVAERVGNSNSPDSIKKLCYRYVNKGAEGQTGRRSKDVPNVP